MTLEELRANPGQAVANGAQLLDRERPGWHRLIDLDTLNLWDATRCICAQLAAHETANTGRYHSWTTFAGGLGAPVVGPHEQWAEWVRGHAFTGNTRAEWKEAILARLALDEMPVVTTTVEEKEEALV